MCSVWFVTGCSSGVGKSLVTTIREAGYRVVATARDIVSLSYIPDGPNVLKLALDVTSKDNITEALSATVANFGRLDVVINNAGYAVMGDTEVIPEADARLEMETLFWGPAFITREAVRIFREVNPAGQGGTVVQMSSIGGLVTFPGSAFYHAGEFALGGFTESLAKEMNPDWKIRFLTVAPVGIQTNFASNIKFAARHLSYDTPEGPLNQFMAYMTNPSVRDAFSTPENCARLLFNVVNGQDERPMPRRLLMGAETIPIIEADLQKSTDELQAWKEEAIRCSAKNA